MDNRNGIAVPLAAFENIPTQSRYYRFMADAQTDWKPYRSKPMYDDHPELASFKSTLYVDNPREGDYIIQEPDNSISVFRPTYPEVFDDVFFDAMPSLQELLDKGIIVLVPEDIKNLDFHLQRQLDELNEEYMLTENALETAEDNMHERRFGFPTKQARESRLVYETLKAKLEDLLARYNQLDAQLQKKVIHVLSVNAQIGSESLDAKIHKASQSTEVIALKHRNQDIGPGR